jgi:hypothetical protein
MKKVVSLALVLIAVVLLTVRVVGSLAQNTTGSIQRTVRDANGGSVATGDRDDHQRGSQRRFERSRTAAPNRHALQRSESRKLDI